MPKLVSIVIPAYNAEQTIGKAIQGALYQDYEEEIEIVVVDDGSQDNTPHTVKSCPSVRYVRQNNGGPASARNRGARESRGEIIFFTDSDAIPRPNWVSVMMHCFEDPTVAVVAGSYGCANPESLLAQCIQAEIAWRHSRFGKHVRAFGSYNVAMRRTVFERVGGFKESYRVASAEDNELSYRLVKSGYSICFTIESKVDHHHPTSLLHYLEQQKQHGVWRVRLYQDHPEMRSGDDYTFWKDVVEPPWVVLTTLVGVSTLVSLLVPCPQFSWLLIIFGLLAAGLFVLQAVFSFSMIGRFWFSCYYSAVMFLRAIARTAGFFKGLLSSNSRRGYSRGFS